MTQIPPTTYYPPNFRDIGGLPTTSNHRVRKALIYRSGSLDQLSQHQLDSLITSFNLTAIFDLRSTAEHHQLTTSTPSLVQCAILHPVPAAEVQDHRATLARFLAESGAADAAIRTAAYTRTYLLLAESGAPAFRQLFAYLLRHPSAAAGGGSVLVHCELGKDRTGVFVAILLKALGVADADVVEDYHRSEGEVAGRMRERMEGLRRLHGEGEGDELGVGAGARSGCYAAPGSYLCAAKEYMSGFLGLFNERYGGGEGYLRKLGFSEDEVVRLREVLLE
ncbi:tyrosine-protein phosphatase [Aspergillus aculeatinus CBS 121060]|uniref:Uncharacterized protein n=1 Tax=Aspergillus aculeatinus CBS 121060 TaxID=1448322 RepID=A0ACD1HMW4_9EURO|nr:hypothetical protein BO66DRAFT_433807 [Aspergillus aculeatinus CBS 121060]RAH74698.1 hypothetical protein BO66DRAFT_433807 [Aspergillus aculeatinus CBS 121060]